MAFFLPPLDLEKITFDGKDAAGLKYDLFARKEFGMELMDIAMQGRYHELVIGLDAQWGDGKTVFVHQWKNLLVENKFHVAYYDAFAHDYYDQPLLPFMAAFNDCLNKKAIDISGLLDAGLIAILLGAKVAQFASLPAEPATGAFSIIASGKKLCAKLSKLKSKNKDAIKALREEMQKNLF